MAMMRSIRLIAVCGVVVAAALAGYLILRGQGVLGRPRLGEVKEVPAGHQEIAMIAPATSDEPWERLVAAARFLVQQWPRIAPDSGLTATPPLEASFERAFLELTADVPEIGLYFRGREQATLWVRWYKVSSEIDGRSWIERLSRRATPPLAILGGDTSDRAVTLGRALQHQLKSWPGKPPQFLISTATADQLIEVYKDRSFRFSFNNTRMALALMEFLHEHREVWPGVKHEPGFVAGLAAAGASWTGAPWTVLSELAAGGHLQAPVLYTLAWSDDGYSRDLADRFAPAFLGTFFPDQHGASSPDWAKARVLNSSIDYGVGDFSMPNPREAAAAWLFLDHMKGFRNQLQILALPTGSQKARRFLRFLCATAPLEVRNLVVMNGDSLTFNHIFRDRDLAWNIVDMPVPLVFFSHRTPVDAEAGFGQKVVKEGEQRFSSTGTQDLLLYADILSAVVQAAFDKERLLSDADELSQRLRKSRWLRDRVFNPQFAYTSGLRLDARQDPRLDARQDPRLDARQDPRLDARQTSPGTELFDALGNRNILTGEHVVWLKPDLVGDRVQLPATITVWSVREIPPSRAKAGQAPFPQRSWRQARPALEVYYNNTAMPGINGHAAD